MSIATVCKANGINLNDRRKVSMGGNEWRDISRVTHICRHHSGVNVDQSMQILEGYWKNSHGWNTGGYHVVIHFNGDVDWNYDYGVISNGVGKHNSYTFHISVLGNGKFTAAQEKSWTVVCKEVQRELGIPTSKVLGHKEFSGHSSNTCPGIKMDTVRAALNNDKPIRNTPSGNNSKPVAKSITTLANEVIDGKHGSGVDRKKSLGSQYDTVQDKVNELLSPKSKPAVKSIDTLVKETLAGVHGNGDQRKKSLGSNYNAVMNIINGKTVNKKSVDTVAREVIAGKFGNGANRKKNVEKAGYNYNEVQKRVNQLL